MIEGFYFSIAGKKTNETINQLIDVFLSQEFVPSEEKKILKHIQDVAANGNYPDQQYFLNFYPSGSIIRYNSIAEIVTYCKKVTEFYHKSFIEQETLKAINNAESSRDLKTRLQQICEESDQGEVVDLGEIKPVLYSDKGHVTTKGIMTGIKELDDVTKGLQAGTVASFCGYVAHGKSTLVESIVFRNILEGKKGIFLSLELPVDMVWSFLEARYMYQVKGIQVTSQDLYLDEIAEDIKEQVISYEQDFLEEFAKNLIIIDESFISKQLMLDYKAFGRKISALASKIGGLDIIAIDHVGQLELMFKDSGNAIIKQLQSFAKVFKDERDVRPVVIFAVQANRQGFLRAQKRNGLYDMLAISELSEVERTSTYVVFLYTSEDMKIMQETKITLAKHRLGSTIPEPITTSFNPEIITVGSQIEAVEMTDSDFNDLGLDLGGDFDSFL